MWVRVRLSVLSFYYTFLLIYSIAWTIRKMHRLTAYATKEAQTGSLCYKRGTNWKFMLQKRHKLEVYATKEHKLEVYATKEA